MQYSQTEVTKRNPMDRPPVTARAVRHSVAHCAVFHTVLFSPQFFLPHDHRNSGTYDICLKFI